MISIVCVKISVSSCVSFVAQSSKAPAECRVDIIESPRFKSKLTIQKCLPDRGFEPPNLRCNNICFHYRVHNLQKRWSKVKVISNYSTIPESNFEDKFLKNSSI